MSAGGHVALLVEARGQLLDMLELLGAASSQLREAITDAEAGNARGAAIVADDVSLTLAELEAKLSETSINVAKFVEGGAA